MKTYVELISSTPQPQRTIWIGMHQCYSPTAAFNDAGDKGEQWYGERVVKHLLKGHRGHYSPLEHTSMTFNAVGYSHVVMQQLTRHRIGVGFSVQSFRYTKGLIMDYLAGSLTIDDVMYRRPEGVYRDRQGNRYLVTNEDLANEEYILRAVFESYKRKIDRGWSEEHARDGLPMAMRQNFVMTVNIRSLMHILDLRLKTDAQLEIRHLCAELCAAFEQYAPEIAAWYNETRRGKARLAP